MLSDVDCCDVEAEGLGADDGVCEWASLRCECEARFCECVAEECEVCDEVYGCVGVVSCDASAHLHESESEWFVDAVEAFCGVVDPIVAVAFDGVEEDLRCAESAC